MRKIKNVILILVIMALVSVACLLIVSALAYIYKWQADKALMGITITYILTGFFGGLAQKILEKENRNIGRKMLEGIFVSSIFVGILLLFSTIVLQQPCNLSSRFMMIWMLLVGSMCLGRIL